MGKHFSATEKKNDRRRHKVKGSVSPCSREVTFNVVVLISRTWIIPELTGSCRWPIRTLLPPLRMYQFVCWFHLSDCLLLTSAPTQPIFRQRLKTYLFSLSPSLTLYWTDRPYLTNSGSWNDLFYLHHSKIVLLIDWKTWPSSILVAVRALKLVIYISRSDEWRIKSNLHKNKQLR